ncbi:MAG TPA: N-acetyl-alpha-D-glucosaminyl L-malate synthase BshA [Clostridiales bacterium]|nr:N-acetyl-alpha-D-glucosaminyl L-malate synthase BshA [Clostridiales bacterium]
MNIGICCYPTYGGSGVVATELGMELASRGHNVHFISYDQPFRLNNYQRNIYFHEVELVDYPVFIHKPYLLALAAKIAQVAQREKLDIIHAHYAIPHSASAYLAREMLDRYDLKTVTTLHGTDITVVGKNPQLKNITEFMINQSDCVTSVSSFLTRHTKQFFNVNKPIKTIYNFINIDRFKRLNAQNTRESLFGTGKKIIIHISNFRPVKRIDDVIKTFDLIQREVDCHLLMVGDGPERNNAYKLAQDLNIISKVHFLGKQTDIVKLLSMSDLFLLTSDTESFGLVALEAMACGVPVIASNAGGIPEVVKHGHTGYLCDIGDVHTMARHGIDILKDDEKLSEMREKSVEHARNNFTADKIIPRYENVYKQLIT